jgi:hypothetical protein
MISVSYKVPVNPEGTDVILNRADVWKGLEAKAHNALPYVPSNLGRSDGHDPQRDPRGRGR